MASIWKEMNHQKQIKEQERERERAFGRAKQALSVSFVNPRAIEADIAGSLDLAKTLLATGATRKLTKHDMLHNDACPNIRVNPQTFDVYVDGALATCEPASVLPLAQKYMLR